MPLPPPTVPRTRMHRRRIELDGFRRDDGLWEVEGHLTDRKDYDITLVSGSLPAGEPVHEMWLRITVTSQMEIVEAVAATDAAPYMGTCERITPDYTRLTGLRIAPGFTRAVKERLGGLRGCTHITELVGALATVAFQTIVSSPHDEASGAKPMHLDGCHALATQGPIVARYYPRWYRAPET